MIALYDHIQELRAELRHCCMTRGERIHVQVELAQAIAEQDALEQQFDREFEMYSGEGR